MFIDRSAEKPLIWFAVRFFNLQTEGWSSCGGISGRALNWTDERNTDI